MTSEGGAVWALVGLGLVGLLGCGGASVDAGLEVELALRHEAEGASAGAGEAREFSTAEGHHVRLTQAWVTVYGLELLACPEASAARPSHGEASPTRLGTPWVEDILRADGERLVVGTLTPPPGDWCTLRVVLEPADEDAEALPAGVDLVGHTVWLAGEVQVDGAGEAAPLVATSAGVRWVDLPLADGLGVELDLEAPTASVDVIFAYDHFLDGVALDAVGAGEEGGAFADDLVDAVAASVSVGLSRP